MRAIAIAIAVAAAVPLASSIAAATTLQVGPGKTYATPCDAIAAAAAGDTVHGAAARSYAGDGCRRGAAGQTAQGKATWVIAGDDTTIEEIELSGATVPDQNGAGIRQEGKNLTIRRSCFHDNEDGILAGDSAGSEILIEMSEFANNGF